MARAQGGRNSSSYDTTPRDKNIHKSAHSVLGLAMKECLSARQPNKLVKLWFEALLLSYFVQSIIYHFEGD